MERRKSKYCEGLWFVLTANYVRVIGYRDGERIGYSKIPEVTKGWLKIVQREMLEIYEEKYPEKTCPICGKTFRDRSKTFCSAECSYIRSHQLATRKVEATCVICGKTFMKQKNLGRITCSDECEKVHRNARIKETWGKDVRKTEQPRKKKKKSQLAKIEKEARAKGLYYADIQKQKTLEMVGGVKL